MALSKAPAPERPTVRMTVGQGPTVLAVGADVIDWTFVLSSIFSLLFLPLPGEGFI